LNSFFNEKSKGAEAKSKGTEAVRQTVRSKGKPIHSVKDGPFQKYVK
jgi:hypothetical protein